MRRTLVASSNEITKVKMVTKTIFINTAEYQRLNLISRLESTINIVSSIARSTLFYKANTKALKIESIKSSSLRVSIRITDKVFIAA